MKQAGYSTVVAVLLSMACSAYGGTAQDAEKLGKELTPIGATKAGNKDNTIPAWDGNDAPANGWAYGKKRGDFWSHKNEKPLFSIDASNLDKYADKLTEGQKELIKAKKGYRMDVYPSHRNCGYPDWLGANAKKNVTEAKIGSNGWQLEQANLPGLPFAMPQSGIEAMWNFIVRYRGNAVEWPDTTATVSPPPGLTHWIQTHGSQTMFYPWGAKGSTTPEKTKNIQMLYHFSYVSPPALAGQNMIWRYYFDKNAEIYYYLPGQRRVRRLPSYSYDAPQIGFENQYTMDELSMFFGDPDRFDWKIVGKKEVFIPYNAFGMYDFKAKFEDVYGREFVNPTSRRYELHRVWVVEGNVKKGMRHSSPRKVFYFDEDSWLAALNEDFDTQGKLWKVREGYSIPVWELGTCDLAPFVTYDLASNRYIQDQTVVSTGKDIKWLPTATGPKYRDDFYTQENLRAISER